MMPRALHWTRLSPLATVLGIGLLGSSVGSSGIGIGVTEHIGTKRPYQPLDLDSQQTPLLHPPTTQSETCDDSELGRWPAWVASVSMTGVLSVPTARASLHPAPPPSPVYLAVLARHGARYPTAKKMGEVHDLARRLRAHASDADDASWTPVAAWATQTDELLRNATAGGLAPQGELEHASFAAELEREYPSAFSAGARVDVRVTSSPRTQDSCLAFRGGLGEAAAAALVHAEEEAEAGGGGDRGEGGGACRLVDDLLLRPFKQCPALKELRRETERLRDEAAEPLFERVRKHGEQLLELPDGWMRPEDGRAAWFGCQLSHTMADRDEADESIACRMVGPFREALSRFEDQENYEDRGFGDPLTREVALPILRRVTQRLHEAAAPDESGPLVDLLFAHDSTIFPFVALLDVLDLGTDPQSSRAGHLCPFSSRATIALRRSGTIAITYNGVKVREFLPDSDADGGGLVAWDRAYAEALDVDLAAKCRATTGTGAAA